MIDVDAIRRRALELFQGFEDIEDPEPLMMVLLDAVTIVETYRRVRTHQVAHLPELTKSVDALLRELEIIDRCRKWESEAPAAPDGQEALQGGGAEGGAA